MLGNSYRVEVPDLSFYQQSVSCQNACPVRTDGRAYVNAIALGDYERAYLIARETNPFASTCGWVCGSPCEAACRRGVIDEPVAIRALKRFGNDRYGVYLGEDAESRVPPAWPGYGGRPSDLDLGNTAIPTGRGLLRSPGRDPKRNVKRVAVVGAGPAGLSCVHDQAARLQICSLDHIFDSGLSILCNGCVDVCPMDCLNLMPATKLEGGDNVAALIQESEGIQTTALRS